MLPNKSLQIGTSIAVFSFLYTIYRNLYKKPQRHSKVSKLEERVLVLGASSGIGRSIARQYAERGARVCVVGRREALVNEVVVECQNGRGGDDDDVSSNDDVFGVAADFANVDDMIRTRDIIDASKTNFANFFFSFSLFLFIIFQEWKGFDTLVVAAGVSALQPLMTIAGVDTIEQATKEGIQRVADVAAAATRGNYVGPLISAVTFVGPSVPRHFP